MKLLIKHADDEITTLWPLVRDWIDQAVKDAANCWTADDVLRDLLGGRMTLWTLWPTAERPTAVLVTEIYETAAGRTCAIPIVGGAQVRECLERLNVVEAYARGHGCVRMRGEGRKGWERALAGHGWRAITTQVEKRL